MKTPRIEAVQPGRAASRGLTIVELLVAVTISLLLIVVIAQLFLGSRQTFATTDDVSRMQENIRFTQQLLIRTIHLAGYKSQPNSITGTVFAAPNPALAAVDGAGTNSDTLTIRYQGAGTGPTGAGADGSVVDCLGMRVNAGVMAINTYSIQPGSNGRNALFCSNLPDMSGARELVPDVENMQVRFGEDTDGDLTTNHYVGLPGVTNMANVLSVRVALLFSTPSAGSKTVADPVKTYDLNGVVLGPYPLDRRIRRPVTITINLRNRTP
jgi:type IV pilus assembly protein PilW